MSGPERSSDPVERAGLAGEGGRRERALMIVGVLLGTVMLATAGILVSGASTARRLDAVDWHHSSPGARDGSVPVAAESRLRTAPPTRAPSAPPTRAPSAPPTRAPSTPPTRSSAITRRPTPKQAHPTSRRTNSTRPTLASTSRTPTPTPTPEPATAPAAQPTHQSVTPPPTAARPDRTHVPPGRTRHPRKH
ncbi:hypothetical protein [Nonomuraea sp. NPDC050786]|uniref:hypothetical protein n=1 Tax=Nonomuraea sp. NPDC050786 TaxID=3154840 RepID=UPI0033F64F89